MASDTLTDELKPHIIGMPTCNHQCQFLKNPQASLIRRECSEYGTPPIWVVRGLQQCLKYKK